MFSFAGTRVNNAKADTTLSVKTSDFANTLQKGYNYEPFNASVPWQVNLTTDVPVISREGVGIYHDTPLVTIDAVVDCGNGKTYPFYWSGRLERQGYNSNYDARYYRYGAYSSGFNFYDQGCSYYGDYYDENSKIVSKTWYTYKASGTATIKSDNLNFTSTISTGTEVFVNRLEGGIALDGPIRQTVPFTTNLKTVAYLQIPGVNISYVYKPAEGIFNFDCDSDGVYELKEVYITGIYTTSKICTYKTAGFYKAMVMGKYRVGGGPWREASAGIDVIAYPEGDFTANLAPKGDKVVVESGGSVQFKADAKNFIRSRIDYLFDCDSAVGAYDNYSSTNPDFNETKDSRVYTCLYNKAGEYLAKFNINREWFDRYDRGYSIQCYTNGCDLIYVRPESSQGAYKGEERIPFTKTVYVTGKIDEKSYMVTTPFDLRWNASKDAACSISGNGVNFSGSDTGSVSVDVPPGTYEYELKCFRKDGAAIQRNISVKAVKP